jgi:hypothetical protein
MKRIGVPLAKSGDRVLVRVDVPTAEELDGGVCAMLCPLYPSYTIQINRADIPLEVLQPHENIHNTPDIAGREFVVLACPMRAFENVIPSVEPESVEKDAWKMRGEFFDLQEEIYELRGFLNRWGLWNWEHGYNTGILLDKYPFAIVLMHLLWEQREKYRKALAGKPRAWLGKASHLSFSTINEPPYFLVGRSYCQDAIEATITIDHLSNVEFGICKRDDCRRLYERTTQQKRLYCSPECAHLANVRKLRAQKKKTESKRKGVQSNAKG